MRRLVLPLALLPLLFAAVRMHARPARSAASPAGITRASGAPLADAVPAPRPTAALRGIVLDAMGKPAADATVDLFLSTPFPSRRGAAERPLDRARSDADGRFELRGADRLTRLVARRGPSELAILAVSGDGPHVLRFRAGARIEARLIDAGGRPIGGAQVRARLRPRGHRFPLEERVAVCDATGAAGIGPLPADMVGTLEANAAGFRSLRSRAIELFEASAALVELTMEPGATIEGVVRAPDGPPLAGAVIEAFQGDGFIHRTVAASDGSFRLDSLAPRAARLIARCDGRAPATVDAEPSAPPLLVLLEGRRP